MGITKKFISAVVVCAMIITMSAVSHTEAQAATKKVTSVKITNVKNKSVTLTKGATYKLKVKVKASKKKYKKVTYKSSNKKVATVSKKGVIKAIKKGKAKITATSVTDKKKKAKITVKVVNKTTNKEETTKPATTTKPEETTTPSPTTKPAETTTPSPTTKPTDISTTEPTTMKPVEEPTTPSEEEEPEMVQVSGTVKDVVGHAVSGAWVFFTDKDSDEIQGSTITDAKGRYSAYVPEGTHEVTVEYLSISVSNGEFAFREDMDNVNLTLNTTLREVNVKLEGEVEPGYENRYEDEESGSFCLVADIENEGISFMELDSNQLLLPDGIYSIAYFDGYIYTYEGEDYFYTYLAEDIEINDATTDVILAISEKILNEENEKILTEKDMASAEEILVGTPVKVSGLTDLEYQKVFKLVPTISGDYVVMSDGEFSVISMCDEDGYYFEENFDNIPEDFEDYVPTYTLESGKTYYLIASTFDYDTDKSFQVVVRAK